MSAAIHTPAPRRRLVTQEMFESVLGTVYAGLVTNALLVISCLPLVVLLVSTDPSTSWPVLALLAPIMAPAYVAASAVFAELSSDGTATAIRTFVRAYATYWVRALAIGALATFAVVVLTVDVVVLWGVRIGAVAIPVLVMLLVLAVVTTIVALVAVVELPSTRLRDLLRMSLYVAVRRWYLSAFSLVVLATLGSLLVARPAAALGLAAAPLLYVVWGGSRFALRAALPTRGDSLTTTGRPAGHRSRPLDRRSPVAESTAADRPSSIGAAGTDQVTHDAGSPTPA